MDEDRAGISGRGADRGPALIDWGRVARRLGVVAAVWIAVAVVGPLVTLAVGGHAATGPWVGIVAVGLAISAVAVVARSAFAGMLRAGDRGQRLAGDDVGLSPPQTRRRSRRRPERP